MSYKQDTTDTNLSGHLPFYLVSSCPPKSPVSLAAPSLQESRTRRTCRTQHTTTPPLQLHGSFPQLHPSPRSAGLLPPLSFFNHCSLMLYSLPGRSRRHIISQSPHPPGPISSNLASSHLSFHPHSPPRKVTLTKAHSRRSSLSTSRHALLSLSKDQRPKTLLLSSSFPCTAGALSAVKQIPLFGRPPSLVLDASSSRTARQRTFAHSPASRTRKYDNYLALHFITASPNLHTPTVDPHPGTYMQPGSCSPHTTSSGQAMHTHTIHTHTHTHTRLFQLILSVRPIHGRTQTKGIALLDLQPCISQKAREGETKDKINSFPTHTLSSIRQRDGPPCLLTRTHQGAH